MHDMQLEERQVPAMTWTMGPDMSGDGWSRGVHPEDLGRWLDTCVHAFDARSPFEIEYRLRRSDGEYRWMLDRGVPRFAADGRFLGYAGVCVDIDRRKRAELELERALARERKLRLAAEKAVRLKDRLIAAAVREALDGGDVAQLRSILAGVRVLVVDGDAGTRESLAQLLRVAGAETKAAPRVAEPFGAWRPDVIIAAQPA